MPDNTPQVMDPRPKGDCRPIVLTLVNKDTLAPLDLSAYSFLVAAKTEPSEGADPEDYVIEPQACTGDINGNVTVDLDEADWLLLEPGERYVFEVEGREPVDNAALIKVQFIQPIAGRVILPAPPVVP